MNGEILIAGIGNIFHRDDAFGVEVAHRMAADSFPPNVKVKDYGIRGFDLMLAMLEGYALTIFVDAVTRGGAPGTVYKIQPEIPSGLADHSPIENGHGLDPVKVLSMAHSLGAPEGRVMVIGCEPATLGDDTGEIGLSEAVSNAVEPAIQMIHSLVSEFNSLTGKESSKCEL